MQRAAAPWAIKTLPVLRTHLCHPTRLAASSSSFHSTPASFAKWSKDKSDCSKNKFMQSGKGARKPSRRYERYVVRRKRADEKKALNNYLLYGKSSPHLEDGSTGRPQSHWRSKAQQGAHNQRKSKKDKSRFCNFFHEDHYVHSDETFEAMFGKHHGFTWSHMSWDDFCFGDRSFRSRWSGGESQRERIPSDGEDESEEDSRETTSVGSHAHRVILGLPPCGPLTLEDVKTAFRASALRWHPDKHPGSSQAVAEEKFKLCVNAYNSLCSVLKAA